MLGGLFTGCSVCFFWFSLFLQKFSWCYLLVLSKTKHVFGGFSLSRVNWAPHVFPSKTSSQKTGRQGHR